MVFNPQDDIAIIHVDDGLGQAMPMPIRSGTSAVTGFQRASTYRRPGHASSSPQRLRARAAAGVDRVRLRTVRPGNSGGPMVDARGRVVATVFAATRSGTPGGYGVPNAVVSRDLDRVGDSSVSTGPCAG